jgi:outer membrane protein assembly factor BamB
MPIGDPIRLTPDATVRGANARPKLERTPLHKATHGALMVAALFLAAPLHAANWPAWRGPGANGVSSEKNLPTRWSTNENVRWRVPLPEAGNSTPVVWGDRIFVTQPIAMENRRTVMCFDRASGRLLWQSGVVVKDPERTHETNPYASGSPVTDGERVIAWFGSGGLVCYDFTGKELWRTDLGKHDHVFGYGGSPVLHGDLCFLNFGPGAREFLLAVNKKTGKEVWRHESPAPAVDDIHGTWSTPLISEWNGRTELISALRGQLAGHDPKTGKVMWQVTNFGIQAKTSPVAGEGVVIISGDLKSAEIAVRLGGSGDVSKTHLLWRKEPPKRRVGTGVIYNGHYFGAQTPGLADCIELKTGRIVWEERLRGSGANNAVWSSPVLSENKLYIVNQNGDVFVLRAGDKFEVIAMNSLGERSNASVVPSNGELLIRTHQSLWCIGRADTARSSPADPRNAL